MFRFHKTGGGQAEIGEDNPMPTTIISSTDPATFPVYGSKAVAAAGTRAAFFATSTPIAEGWAWVIAWPENTGTIYVGDVAVTSSNGVRLGASASVPIRWNELADIYIDASVSGEGASIIGW
jgi:hypothetical protein